MRSPFVIIIEQHIQSESRCLSRAEGIYAQRGTKERAAACLFITAAIRSVSLFVLCPATPQNYLVGHIQVFPLRVQLSSTSGHYQRFHR